MVAGGVGEKNEVKPCWTDDGKTIAPHVMYCVVVVEIRIRYQ
jgi:hypothetical protein